MVFVMVSRLTLRLRLTVAFIIVLLSTIGLGLFSIQRLSAVNASAKVVATDNWLPAANALGSLSQDFELLRSRQGQVLRGRQPGARRKFIGQAWRSARKKTEADLKAYEPLVTSGRERSPGRRLHQCEHGRLS